MINVTRNYLPTYGTFQFRSFVWSHNDEDPIYLFCDVKICDSYENECDLVSKPKEFSIFLY